MNEFRNGIKQDSLGIACDLVTGEERRHAIDSDTPSSHVAMTVEMVPVDVPVEVAVIDEIQMLRDLSRGWAWTRALLGIAADEVHYVNQIVSNKKRIYINIRNPRNHKQTDLGAKYDVMLRICGCVKKSLKKNSRSLLQIHLCGEPAAVDIVRALLDQVGEHVEVLQYERKTPLIISKEPLSAFDNVEVSVQTV